MESEAERRLLKLELGPVVPSQLNPHWHCLILTSELALEHLHKLRQILPPGLICFMGAYSERSVFYPERSITTFHELVLAPGQHPFDCLHLAATGAPTDLKDRLHQWDARFGVELVQVDQRSLSFNLESIPADLPGFVEELYQVAPDSVDVGWVGTLEDWAETIRETRAVGLLWI